MEEQNQKHTTFQPEEPKNKTFKKIKIFSRCVWGLFSVLIVLRNLFGIEIPFIIFQFIASIFFISGVFSFWVFANRGIKDVRLLVKFQLWQYFYIASVVLLGIFTANPDVNQMDVLIFSMIFGTYLLGEAANYYEKKTEASEKK
jgi:hypothetical protein